jgi:ATP-dependent exoDNAse (exonuclease V) alpha subunit
VPDPTASEVPLRHLSIRVPWHDSGWTGVVCKAPHLNGSCAKLKRIAGQKKDEEERRHAGVSLEQLPQEQWPCCIDERAAFMAPFEMTQTKTHALARTSPKHYGHFLPTPQRYPAYSAGIVPFRWMMRGNIEEYRDDYGLSVDDSLEPDLGYESNWVHNKDNQCSLLNGFASHLRKDQSLCFFYAKHVPFIEGTCRVLIGAGRVSHVGPLTEYARDGEGMAGMVWERPIQHSIRSNASDGFLVPYAQILARAETDPALDIGRYAPRAPEEHFDEFSYTSELVTHDGAIGALLALDSALGRSETELGIATQREREWVNTELVRLWKVRGPFPGLGAVLTAFGLTRGVFVAHALQTVAGENVDPWPVVDQTFADGGTKLPKALRADLKELAPTWKSLPAERRAYLRLLSRFELRRDHAEALYEKDSRSKNGWDATDKEILQNPYRLYELTRHSPDGVKLLTVDRGVFPDDVVRLVHPLESPSGLESSVDQRRVKAFTIGALEDAAAGGHTLLPRAQVADAITARAVRPPCQVTGDILSAALPLMRPHVQPAQVNDEEAFQLDRYRTIAELVQKQVKGRTQGIRHTIKADWDALLNEKFKGKPDAEERRAREEKAAALKELAEARLSVLVGPAGAGKTTVLGILCERPEIRESGLLLLAPTGKARVRMQELTSDAGKAMTLAQFLNQHGRYDGASGRYLINDLPKAKGYGTVIVDESSMLTEDMLGSLFDALHGVNRIIFVGDPSQLPPIGAGRPFVDMVAMLRPDNHGTTFPRVASGYAELTVERRQIGGERPDLRLARWFSSTPAAPGEDDVFSEEIAGGDHIRFVEWTKPEDLYPLLLRVLAEELKLAGSDDVRGFNRALGATVTEKYDYFNASKGHKQDGAVHAVDRWQILSPLRGTPMGVEGINRLVHERFRSDFLKLATQPQKRSIPKPMGAERVIYGDKVINVSNHRRDGKRVYPADGALGYLANGEVGIAVGQWKSFQSPSILHVEFSSQRGYTYSFFGSDFGEEGDAALELAYALTVHKAQGSQFGLVVLVLPAEHRMLSRELVYTSLTRHQQRVIVVHQGPRSNLWAASAPDRSEIARRMTNMLHPCRMLEFPKAKGSQFLQKGLIHRTAAGIAVRSKSEVIIADALSSANLFYNYEAPLTLNGHTRYPDFTINDEISGRIVYWEHLGMLENDAYRRGWERKLAWYRAGGVAMNGDEAGSKGTLVTTTESSAEGFDSARVQAIIKKHLS